MSPLPNTYKNQYYESKLLGKSLLWVLKIIYGQILNIDIIVKSGMYIEIQFFT